MGEENKLVEIKSVNAWSVFKLAFVAYVIVGLLVGVLFGIFAGLAGGIAAMAEGTPFEGMLGLSGGFFGGVLIGILGGFVYGIFAAISTAIAALLYDLFAAIAGGIKIRLKS